MAVFGGYPRTCERARTWTSLQLDGELSELERALLNSHLSRCDACAGFAEEVGAATRELRAAQLERPARPLVAPSRRRFLRPAHVSAAAAVLAGVVGLGALVDSISSAGETGPARMAARIQLNPINAGENVLLRQVRLAYIEGERARDRQPQRGLGIVV